MLLLSIIRGYWWSQIKTAATKIIKIGWFIEAKDKQAKKYLGTVVSNFDLQISYACWYNNEIVVSTIINCNEI